MFVCFLFFFLRTIKKNNNKKNHPTRGLHARAPSGCPAPIIPTPELARSPLEPPGKVQKRSWSAACWGDGAGFLGALRVKGAHKDTYGGWGGGVVREIRLRPNRETSRAQKKEKETGRERQRDITISTRNSECLLRLQGKLTHRGGQAVGGFQMRLASGIIRMARVFPSPQTGVVARRSSSTSRRSSSSHRRFRHAIRAPLQHERVEDLRYPRVSLPPS